MRAADADPVHEALDCVREASKMQIPLRLVGGLAIRFLCPHLPPRRTNNQDLDFASLSRAKPVLVRLLTDRGYLPAKRFNALHGHKHLYFSSRESGRGLDILIDRFEMCHVLDFRNRLDQLPYTLSPCDLLLSKLQIVDLNQKDAQDALYLLSSFPVREGNDADSISLARFQEVVGNDWGWWRTVTLNLERLLGLLAEDDRNHLVPGIVPVDPGHQIRALMLAADTTRKSVRWRVRSVIGERVSWYAVPEEISH